MFIIKWPWFLKSDFDGLQQPGEAKEGRFYQAT